MILHELQQQRICSCGQIYYQDKNIKQCKRRNHLLLNKLDKKFYSFISNLLHTSIYNHGYDSELNKKAHTHALNYLWDSNKGIIPPELKKDIQSFCYGSGGNKQLRKYIEIWLMETGIDKYGGHSVNCLCETCFTRYFATKHVEPIRLCPQCQNPKEYDFPYKSKSYKNLEEQHKKAIEVQWELRNIIDIPKPLKPSIQEIHYICDKCNDISIKSKNIFQKIFKRGE